MSFWTIVEGVPEDLQEEVRRLCETIQARDDSFAFRFTRIDGELALLIESESGSQARSRGKWITKNVEILRGRSYRVSRAGEKLKRKPGEVIGLLELWRRRKYWKELSEP